MGAASVLNILSGVVKMKAAAVLLGPAGVGLVGLYQNLVQTASTVSALGLGSVGTRQIAAAQATGDGAKVGEVRRALFWATLALSALGALIFVAASGWIAEHLLAAPEHAGDVAWLAAGVAFTVAAGSQGALLTGLRRIGDLARLQVLTGVLSAALGVAAIWWWGAQGLLALVLAAPVVRFAAGHYYVARLGPPQGPTAALSAMADEWRRMAALGLPFMLSGLVTVLGHLAVRSIVQRELGADDLGYFQAAWAVGMLYLGFVLGAMGTDYYPRLTAAIGDRQAATRLVNEQTEVALLLCGPAILGMLALAPWVIRLLYTAEFAPAAEVLRWQLLGDMLKVMSWPLGFVLLAAGAGRTFIATESSGIGVFVAGAALAVPAMGVAGTGAAFLALYVWYLPLVYLLARRRIGFRWSARVKRQALALGLSAAAVAGAARVSEAGAAALGVALAGGFGLYGLAHLGQMAELSGPLGRLSGAARIVLKFFGRRE